MKKLLFILLVPFLVSCKCNQLANSAKKHSEKANDKIEKLIALGCDFELDSVLKSRTIKTITKVDTIVVDTTIYIEVPSDKLIWEQKLRCDELGNVIVELENKLAASKRIKGKATVKNNVLTIECNTDSLLKELRFTKNLLVAKEEHINTLNQDVVNLKKIKDNSRLELFNSMILMILVIVIILASMYVFNKLTKGRNDE